MHDAPQSEGDEIVRTARIDKGADAGGNDRQSRIAWAAGFVDGEGCISIYPSPNGRSFNLRMTVTQVDTRPLELLREMWGGFIGAHKNYNVKKHRRTRYWTVQARLAAAALAEMLPYLIVKKDEAVLGLEFQSKKGRQPRNLDGKRGGFPLSDEDFAEQRRYAEEIKRLKRRVWS